MMTTHLTPEELVDFVEGQLDPGRARHLDDCERCRREASGLDGVVAHTRDVTVPEPSPLFWRHQRERIHAAVTSALVGRRAWWPGSSLGRLSVAAASALVAVVVIGVSTTFRGVDPEPIRHGPVLNTQTPPGLDAAGDEGAAWTLLLTVAERVDWRVPGGDAWPVDLEAIDGAVSQLSTAELNDLVRLLEAELEDSSL